MSTPKSLDAADCVVFGVLTALGYLVGIYFAVVRRRSQVASGDRVSPEMEAFLGGRSLPAYALTVSVLASAVNGLAVVAFIGHYYGHGFHILWWMAVAPVSVLVTSMTLVPLLYKLRVASIFQYLRLRFDNKVGITACIIYFIFSQTLGAVGIYSAAIGVSTMFALPLMYSNIAIGLAGTVYTALGGLRGVVWADCVQAAVMFASPIVIIGKVIYDSSSASPPLRPLSNFNLTEYMFRTNFDLANEENVWSILAGALPFILVRTGFDQMAVQRFIAARTVRQAKWISVAGASSFAFFILLDAFGALALIYWYRDCDPLLAGAIRSHDQIVPYFVRERLSDVTALRGLFLAGLLGASTSTVSSVVNSHAAIFYIDVVSPFVKISERRAVVVMRLLAFASGTIMTIFAIAVPYMGSAAMIFMALYTAASGLFAGLVLLGISSPWVNAKGAAWTCLLVCAVQLWHGIGSGLSGFGRSPVITGTLDRCPLPANGTKGTVGIDAAVGEPLQRSPYVFPLYLVSYFWIAFFGFLFTIVLATALSLATGECPRWIYVICTAGG
ncbi:sodium-coupled monocarboxylate transporter 2-like [Amblyomma americanum]